jgi:hypothetical protein
MERSAKADGVHLRDQSFEQLDDRWNAAKRECEDTKDTKGTKVGTKGSDRLEDDSFQG